MTTPEQLAVTVRANFMLASADPLDVWFVIDGNYTRPATTQEVEMLAALDSLLTAYEEMRRNYLSQIDYQQALERALVLAQERGDKAADRVNELTEAVDLAVAINNDRVEELVAAERALEAEAKQRIKDCEDRNAYKRRADIAEREVGRLKVALLVIPPDKMEALAAWLDLQDAHDGRNDDDEVQRDLREMATKARAALGSEPE